MSKSAKPAATLEAAELARLVQSLKGIQVCRGQLPWRYLEMPMGQLKAVMLLGRLGRVRSRELADGLNIAPSAATPLVDRLVQQKLARRVDDDNDRRIVWIQPTAKAEGIYNELLDINEQIIADVLKEIPAAEHKTVKHGVSLLVDAAIKVLEKDKQVK